MARCHAREGDPLSPDALEAESKDYQRRDANEMDPNPDISKTSALLLSLYSLIAPKNKRGSEGVSCGNTSNNCHQIHLLYLGVGAAAHSQFRPSLHITTSLTLHYGLFLREKRFAQVAPFGRLFSILKRIFGGAK